MKIICFSSHTATWYFAFAEAVVASELQKKGHEVIYITSGSHFGEISSLDNERILRKKFNLKGYEIKSELLKKDLKEISSIIKKLNKNNFDKLIIDGVKVGKIALYEFLLTQKKMDLSFTQDEWKKCIVYIKNTLKSLYACRSILKKENPDKILIYGTLYSINHAWEKYAKSKGIPVYFLHHGVNISDIDNTLIIAKNNAFYFNNKLKQYWSKLKDDPINRKMLSYVTDHLLELLKAKHYLVYSTPKSKELVNIRKIYNIGKNQKILTVTMSSYDELFAAEYVGAWSSPKKLIFANQIDWIEQLIKYVKDKKDYFLLIRVHPREFPNKRDGVKSQHAKMLEIFFKNLPENVKVNWPTDEMSIYDLAQETDVFLNAWSTVGIEMSLLGIPVVIYSKDFIQYPADLNYLAKSRKDYFTKIELAIKEGWSFDKIKRTYRWLALCYCRTIIRFRNTLTEFDRNTYNKSIPVILKYYYWFLRKIIDIYTMLFGKNLGFNIDPVLLKDCDRQLYEHINITRLEEMLSRSGDTLVDMNETSVEKVEDERENQFIRHEIGRIYKSLYGEISKKTKINKNSLQYNLKRVLI